jgi:cell division protein FtsB
MDDNLANFLILAVAILSTVALVVSTSWLRNRLRLAEAAGRAGAPERVEQLSAENETLRGQVSQMKERLEVLERIATDPAERTAREIEQLRS